MLYYLFDYLDKLNFPGAGLFHFISFRAAMALITSLVVSIFFGKKIINLLRKQQIGETVRDLGLAGQIEKSGTPTMGGIIILSAIVIPTLLFAKLHNIYVITMLLATLWLGAIGFLDDYIKVFKKDKKGLHGKFKIVGQVGLGIIVGCTLYWNENVTLRREVVKSDKQMQMAIEKASPLKRAPRPASHSAADAGSGTGVAVKFALSGAKSEIAAKPLKAPSRGHRFQV